MKSERSTSVYGDTHPFFVHGNSLLRYIACSLATRAILTARWKRAKDERGKSAGTSVSVRYAAQFIPDSSSVFLSCHMLGPNTR